MPERFLLLNSWLWEMLMRLLSFETEHRWNSGRFEGAALRAL